MPIELRTLAIRKHVVWLAVEPPEDGRRVFEERGCVVESCTDKMLGERKYLSGLFAVVFTQNATDLGAIANDLKNHAERLLDFDCQIILRAAPGGLSVLLEVIKELKIPVAGLPQPEADQLKWQKYPDGIPPAPYAGYFVDTMAWNKIANFVSESPPGPAPNLALVITLEPKTDENREAAGTALRPSAELLIRRAFWDCAEVHLSPMMKGKSGVDVYRACSVLNGISGQPRFVKLGGRTKILREYLNYVDQVEPYIPFHLGPHLVRDRCCLGANEGILVGDYVEESEDLCDCAPAGRSVPAIACLFDRTLLGWHRGARKEMTSISNGFLARFPKDIDTGRMDKARQLGATLDLKALQRLFRRCTSEPVLVGPIHGDLHAGNVRVRATDAIVIDFLQHRNQPLVYDAACLEASLLAEGFVNDRRKPLEWLESLEPLYEMPLLERADSQPDPKNQSFWFQASVQQIRRYAREWECGPNQYAGVLAFALLFKAVRDPEAPEGDSYRRAGAYVIAEKILSSTFGDPQHVQEALPKPAVAS